MQLVRIGNKNIKLHEKLEQLAKNARSYDFVLSADGFINPNPDDIFREANGLSLFPYSTTLIDLLEIREGKVSVVVIPKGAKIPDELVLIHEFGEHFSLQTNVKATPDEVNSNIMNFFEPFEMISKEEYFDRVERANEN